MLSKLARLCLCLFLFSSVSFQAIAQQTAIENSTEDNFFVDEPDEQIAVEEVPTESSKKKNSSAEPSGQIDGPSFPDPGASTAEQLFDADTVSESVEPSFADEEADNQAMEPPEEDPIQFAEEEESSRPSVTPRSQPPKQGTYGDVLNTRGATVQQGETKIRHPFAEKGLIRITKDKTYVYQVSKSKQDRAISFRGGLFEPTELGNPETGATFSDTYDQTQGPIVFFEYEWQWLRGSLGKLGFKVGSGVFATQGNGRFRNEFDENGPDRSTPKEQFTFVAFPNSASAVYRFQLYDDQMFVPYVDGGVMAMSFLEWRDDLDFPKLGLSPTGFFSGGMAFNLQALDSLAILGLDREYGINNIYFMAEFRQLVNIGSDYDFTAPAFNGGFMFEF